MRGVRAQYFLTFAVTGSWLPFASVYFADQGLSSPQIGYVSAVSSVAVILSPVLVTLLADTRIDARRLMTLMFALAAAAMAGVVCVSGFWPIFLLWGLHSLAFVAIMPLQDGILFSLQKQARESGLPVSPYHRVRVWGSAGFIAAGLPLFFLLKADIGIWVTLLCASACCAAGAINSLRLPDPRIRFLPHPEEALPDRARLPTADAARALLHRPVLIFCLAIFLLHIASAAYYAFYPIYLRDDLKLGPQWLGPVQYFGVMVEVLFMLSFGRLSSRLGLRNFMILGTCSVVLRMGLLALFPTVGIAVGTQALHGLMVLVMQVAPPVFLNQHADDHYRHSLQGLYTMLIAGVGRSVGFLAAGPIAKWSLPGLFAYAAALGAISVLLIFFAFHDRHPAKT